MPLRDTVIRVKGKGKDVKRRLLFAGERLLFLKPSGESGTRFTVVLEPTEGWLVTWNEYRGQMTVRYSTNATNFKDLIATVSHVGYGLPVGGKIDLYSIDPDRRDVVPPSANNSDWKVYVTRDAKSRYTLPT